MPNRMIEIANLLLKVNSSSFFLSLGTPEHKNDSFSLLIDNFDNMVGKLLPPFVFVRVRSAFSDCEYSVK